MSKVRMILGLILICFLVVAPALASSATVNAVKVIDGTGNLKIIVSADQPVKYRTMRMSSPRVALVLEVFPAKVSANLPAKIEVNRGLVERVRIAQFSERPDIARLVVDLISPAEFNVVTSPDKGELHLIINTVKLAEVKKPEKVVPPPAKEIVKPISKPEVKKVETAKPVAKAECEMTVVTKPARPVEAPKPVAVEKPKPVAAEKPKAIVVVKPKPVVEKPKPVAAEKPKAVVVVVKPKPVVEKPKPVAMMPKPEVKKVKQVALKTEEVAKKPRTRIVIEKKKEKMISLDFVEANFVYVIKLLAKEIGVNMVIDNKVIKGDEEVTISLKDVTPEAALNLILKLSGFEFMRVNDTIIVGSKETVDRIPKDIMKKGVERTVTQKIYLEYADPDALAKRLAGAYPAATIQPMVGIRGIIVTAPLSQVREIKQEAAQIDVAGKGEPAAEKAKPITEFIQLKFSKAKEVKGQIGESKMLSGDTTMIVDENLNLLILMGPEEEVRKAKDYIAKLEHSRLRQMVRLDVKVVDLTESGSKRLGMNWAGSTGGQMGIMDPVSWTETPKSPTDIGFGFFTRSPMVLKSTLSILVSSGDARIVASPTISTLSGKEAEIRVGETYPYVFQDPRSGQYQLQNIEYLTKLVITPTVSNEEYSLTDLDKVLLEVDIDVSDKRGTETSLGIPIRGTKAVKTKLIVPSGETLVIGGLMSVEDNFTLRKIPLLGDLPIIGLMFQSKEIDKINREVIIMITPTILKEAAVE